MEGYHEIADTTSSSGEDEDEEGDAAGDVIEEMFISDECDSPSARAMKEPLSQCQQTCMTKCCGGGEVRGKVRESWRKLWF